MLFDTHIHLDQLTDLQQQIEAARTIGVTQFLLPGIHPKGWPELISLASSHDGVLAAPGVHPLAAHDWSHTARDTLISFSQRTETVAIGEIGLDGLIDVPMSLQETVLREQLRIAVDCRLPVVLHCRRATGRLMQILGQEQAGRVGGILHSFSGSLETAHEAINLGFALGIGGPVTFPNARRIPEIVGQLPEEWIVLETDAPDLAPHPHRGELNRPIWLKYVQYRVAELRGWTAEETAAITTRNANRVLCLSEENCL